MQATNVFLAVAKSNTEVVAQENNNSLQDQITELFAKLLPNLWIMLATLISLIILLIVLTFFVYKPTKKMIEKRKQFIQSNIDAAVQSREKALDLEKTKNQQLIESRLTANEIVHKARLESEKMLLAYTDNAKNESKKILDNAYQSIKLQQEKFQKESQKEIMDVAVKIAEKILEEKLTVKDEKKILAKFLKKD